MNKYFVGTAVVQAPFFAIACFISWLSGVPIDGYSWPFQLLIGIAAILCFSLGNWYLFRTLQALGFRKWAIGFTLLFISFGTNLLYYTVYEPSMSHVYSFCTISGFLYYTRRALKDGNGPAIVWAGVFLSITTLIRPVNALVLFGAPAVTGGLFGFVSGLETVFKQKRVLLASVSISLGIILLQPLMYWVQTGHPLVWSYKEEGFDFLNPEFINVLFSYRKGLFIYCPILVIAAMGAMVGATKKRFGFGPLLFFLAAVTWVISSWWMWYYGGSYGMRPFIDYYPFFAIGLAYALDKGIGFLAPKFLTIVGVVLLVVQGVQTYQYVNYIIPFDNMNKTKYWNLFLETDKSFAWYYSGYLGEDSYTGIDSLLMKHQMEKKLGWGNEHQLSDSMAFKGVGSAIMESDQQYGITLRSTVSDSSVAPDVIRVSAWVRPTSKSTDLKFVCSIEDSTGKAYYWNSKPLRPQFNDNNEWSWVTALFKCGRPKNANDVIVVFPMRSDRSTIHVDDLEISFVQTK